MAAALALFLLFAATAAVLLSTSSSPRAPSGISGMGETVPCPAGLPFPSLLPRPLPRGTPPSALLRRAAAASSSSSTQLCAVCLESARAGERWRALPACGHAFHATCVDRWLARAPACPLPLRRLRFCQLMAVLAVRWHKGDTFAQLPWWSCTSRSPRFGSR
ncbi:hypothetical protein GUJ93_ZPchr1161g40552 [Zizania palustris]|uniref:RING-type domain-containing protein n=1 Tax=Zizania palustris TaxID=103762 RepID=A0A8J5VBC0_ZIZPA|nr:hypothetical protein GUJ93_ZPchr1161g40552 [Zizania palustris]